jgi:sugar/nucleoside kinase (ribokinase family)
MSLVVGSIAFDTIKNVHGKRERIVGGSSTYYAYAASLFENPKVVGVVGEDFPEEIIKEMGERGIDTKGIMIEKGKTFFWEGEYSDDFSERTSLKTELNVFEHFNPVIPDDYKKEKNVFLANIAPELQKKVIEQTGADKYFVMDTMNLWINISRDKLTETIKSVNGIIINDEEAKMLTGEHYLFEAAKKIKKSGPEFVLIKKGEHGSMLYFEEKFFVLPPYPKEIVIDPTGAGDSYAGAFMGFLNNTDKIDALSLKKGMVYGTIVSSFTIEDFGIERLRNLKREDVENRLKEYKEMIDF